MVNPVGISHFHMHPHQLPMLKGCQMVHYVLALPFTAGANKIMKNGKNVTWPGNFNAR
jgi:hypothetical protein